jgi:predicted nucleic acid-binding protein
LELLVTAIKEGDINFIFITPERFTETASLRIKFDDKPRVSFTDLSSMVVMEEFAISQILTADAHFAHVGKGFQIVP